MNKTYSISRPGLFGNKYIISDEQSTIATIKCSGMMGTKATAEFNGIRWIFKHNFLNNKVSIYSVDSEPTSAYVFKASILSASSKGFIEFEGKTYNFKQLFGKWAGYVWFDDGNNYLINYTMNGLLGRRGKISLSDKVPNNSKLTLIIVLGLYLINYSFHSQKTTFH